MTYKILHCNFHVWDEVAGSRPQYLHAFTQGLLQRTLNAWMPTSPYSAVSLSLSQPH